MTISEMNCERFDEALSDFLEGSLDDAARTSVERHLKECVRCTSLVRDLEKIQAEAATLPDLVPSRDLWSGIEARIAASVIPLAPKAKDRRFAPWMAAAAAALIVSTAGITYMLTASSVRKGESSRLAAGTAAPAMQSTAADEPNGSAPAAPQPSESASQPAPTGGNFASRNPGSASTHSRIPGAQLASQQGNAVTPGSDAVYGREIDMLQKIVDDRKTQLDPSTVAIIEKNLRIIDAAIAQSKAALAKDPASVMLSQQLTRSLDKKVELLRTAALLPAST